MPLLPPAPLAEYHEFDAFHSGEGELDEWLRQRARKNHASGASRVYVTWDKQSEGRLVAGYYALATGSISRESVAGSFRRNMPELFQSSWGASP